MDKTLVAHDSFRLVGQAMRAHLGNPAFRVLLLIPIIWFLNLTDLVFTILASRQSEFIELNPLASSMGPLSQIVFKVVVLCFFTAMAVHMRRRRGAEFGCYILLAVYGTLAAVWLTEFRFVLSPSYIHQFLAF